MTSALLINPPFLDPTVPPHFAAYIIGATRNAGMGTVVFKDINVNLYNYLIRPDIAESILADRLFYLREMESQDRLSTREQLSYRTALKCIGLNHKHIAQAHRILTCDEYFYDYSWYKAAAQIIQRYIAIVWCKTAPAEVGFGTLNCDPATEFSSVEGLCNQKLTWRFVEPIKSFLDEQIQDIVDMCPAVIGLSCNYISQLPITLYLLREISSAAPRAVIVLGGTEITSIYKNIKNERNLWDIFGKRTVLVIGEGESAFVELIKHTLHGNVSALNCSHPNVITSKSLSKKTNAAIEDINCIGEPAYDIYDLSKYWAAEPVLMYSPTRGCYWNKCTFCDYGLNFGSPTSPSRQRSEAGLASDLGAISKCSKAVYLAVDAISPSFLKKISTFIRNEKFGLIWSGEIRLEGHIGRGKIATDLAEGGCVGLSFGFESASQRILDLIDKGVIIDKVPGLLSALNLAGIHVQLMGFTGFPTETLDEAKSTYDFLIHHLEKWTFASIGTFSLTPGSIVAKTPHKFNLQSLIPVGKDIVREFIGSEGDDSFSGARNNGLRVTYANLLHRGELSRPFVGGIDTAHTLLYFNRYRSMNALIVELAKLPRPLVPTIRAITPFENIFEFPSSDAQIVTNNHDSSGFFSKKIKAQQISIRQDGSILR